MEGSPLTESIKRELHLLERTIKILCLIENEQPIGINKISSKMNLPEHKVRYSLRMLQKENLIQPSPRGAQLTEKHDEFKGELRNLLNNINETACSLDEEIAE